MKTTLRTCPNGHSYHKSSDCPSCPVCERERKPGKGILSLLGAPARRALEGAGIHTAAQLSQWTEKDILKLHGMGPASMPILKKALTEQNLSFRT